jgi:hypothetical protein
MIRRSPSERYLKYLLSHPAGYSNDLIIERCQRETVSYVGVWYLESLRGGLQTPAPFFPKDRMHSASSRWLLGREIYHFYHQDESQKIADKIFKTARIREFVESMSLSGAPEVAIANHLTQAKGFYATTNGVLRYLHHYWDVKGMDSTEIRALIHFEMEKTSLDGNPEIQAQYKSLKQAYYTDARKTAADLPSSPMAALISQLRLGVMPAKMELGRVLEAARYVAALRAFEAAFADGPRGANKFNEYSNGIEKITKTLEQIVRPDDKLRDDLMAIALQTDDSEIPYADDLDGTHTVDMIPEITQHALPAGADDGDGSEDPLGEGGRSDSEDEDLHEDE